MIESRNSADPLHNVNVDRRHPVDGWEYSGDKERQQEENCIVEEGISTHQSHVQSRSDDERHSKIPLTWSRAVRGKMHMLAVLLLVALHREWSILVRNPAVDGGAPVTSRWQCCLEGTREGKDIVRTISRRQIWRNTILHSSPPGVILFLA